MFRVRVMQLGNVSRLDDLKYAYECNNALRKLQSFCFTGCTSRTFSVAPAMLGNCNLTLHLYSSCINICPVTQLFSHCIASLFLARTHVNYEVKDDVAVVRINDPNSKV